MKFGHIFHEKVKKMFLGDEKKFRAQFTGRMPAAECVMQVTWSEWLHMTRPNGYHLLRTLLFPEGQWTPALFKIQLNINVIFSKPPQFPMPRQSPLALCSGHTLGGKPVLPTFWFCNCSRHSSLPFNCKLCACGGFTLSTFIPALIVMPGI